MYFEKNNKKVHERRMINRLHFCMYVHIYVCIVDRNLCQFVHLIRPKWNPRHFHRPPSKYLINFLIYDNFILIRNLRQLDGIHEARQFCK